MTDVCVHCGALRAPGLEHICLATGETYPGAPAQLASASDVSGLPPQIARLLADAKKRDTARRAMMLLLDGLQGEALIVKSLIGLVEGMQDFELAAEFLCQQTRRESIRQRDLSDEIPEFAAPSTQPGGAA